MRRREGAAKVTETVVPRSAVVHSRRRTGAASYGRCMFGALVPFQKRDFGRSGSRFGGKFPERGLGPRWRECEVIADRAERLSESIY